MLKKRLFNFSKLSFLIIFACATVISISSCGSNMSSGSSDAGSGNKRAGTYPSEGMFPSDFPPAGHNLTDDKQFGQISGFGGDSTKTKDQHVLKKTPVILVHGNGASATHSQWGMQELVPMLQDIGYSKDEIWAISYLGTGIADYDPMNPMPIANNVGDFRRWIAAVMDYLNVDKVDIITHSLGASVVRGWIEGYTTSQTFTEDLQRDKVGTVFLISGANYGYDGFGGEWKLTHPFYDTVNEPERVAAVKYISVRAINDVVDEATIWGTPTPPGFSKASTSLLVGAYKNFEFNVPADLPNGSTSIYDAAQKRHSNAVRWRPLFDEAVAPYLSEGGKSITILPELTLPFEEPVNATVTVIGYSSAEYKVIDESAKVLESGSITIGETKNITITETSYIEVTAYGESAVVTETSQLYVKDEGKPIITFNPDGGIVAKDTSVTISANRNTTSLEVSLNGETNTISGNTTTVQISADSELIVKATNDKGISTKSATYEVTTCLDATSTLTAHVDAGRAYTKSEEACWFGIFCFGSITTYYAKGSDENLGTVASTTVSLKTEDNTKWTKGVCGDDPTGCNHCASYSCCTSFGCAGYSYVSGGMKCYEMTGYSLAPCSCWQ